MTDPVMLLSQIHGEGRVTFRALRAAGFFTLSSVADASVQVLADRAHLSARTARRLKSGAEDMIGKGIGKDHPEPVVTPRSGRGRQGRPARARVEDARRAITFSQGVSIEEALLLVQSAEAGETADLLELSLPAVRLAEIAAAAEAAAALTRPCATAPPPTPDRACPRDVRLPPGETFWAFG